MTANYKDYGYRSADAGYSCSYLLPGIRRMLGPPDGAILDLGCGNGAIARSLLAEGYDVYGVDASESGIEIASREAKGRFFVMDLSRGHLPAEIATIKFGTVVSTEVIEHLYAPRGLVAIARNVLPKGGAFILSTPYHGYLKNLALAITGKLDAHYSVLWDGGHIKFFSRRTLEQMLVEQGFLVEQFSGAGRMPLLWRSMILKARAI